MIWMSKKEKRSLTRRRTLQSIGAGVVGISGITNLPIVRAEKESHLDKHYKKALKIREKTGSREKFIKYLNKHLDVSESRKSVAITTNQSDDGYSIQYYPEYRINGYLTMTYDGCDSGYVYTDFEWQFEQGGFPEDPHDLASLHWASNHFSRVPDTEYGGPYVCVDNYCANKSSTGFAARFDEVGYVNNSSEPNDGDGIDIKSNFGLKAQKIDNNIDPQSRFMTADYKH